MIHNGTIHYRSKEDENNENNPKGKESSSIEDPLLQFDLNSDNFDLPDNDENGTEKEGSQRSKQKEMQTKTDGEKFSKTKKKQKMSRKMDVKVTSLY